MAKQNFLKSSVSHDPSQITNHYNMLICCISGNISYVQC